jgi:hypothetical protein
MTILTQQARADRHLQTAKGQESTVVIQNVLLVEVPCSSAVR